VIVPTASASAVVAFWGLARLTLKRSSGSSTVSPLTCTATVLDVCPGAKVSVSPPYLL
jgi:hypothetical protein